MARCPGRQKTPHSRKGCVAKRVRVGLIRKNPRKGFLWGSIAYLAGAVKPWGRGGPFLPQECRNFRWVGPSLPWLVSPAGGPTGSRGFSSAVGSWAIMGRPTRRWSRRDATSRCPPVQNTTTRKREQPFVLRAGSCLRAFCIFREGNSQNARNNLESCKKERGRRGQGAREQAGRIAEKDGKLCRKCNVTVRSAGENHVKTSEKGCWLFGVG